MWHTDRCINALESCFWDASETCCYKPNTAIDSSGRDQLRFPCPSRDARQRWARVNAISPSSFTTCFNMNKHDWKSHASCNCSISVLTAERHQQNSLEICYVAFHLLQQAIRVHSSLEERSILQNITLALYFTEPVSLSYRCFSIN